MLRLILTISSPTIVYLGPCHTSVTEAEIWANNLKLCGKCAFTKKFYTS